ncbi:hypothetical protein ACFQFC_23110 [Amorphoplanes digitatis]|uniref:Uncharacterized protein n=1 Tax=Actinoplanes digitatis TaxID=1868 RepID=A0A7W7MUU6_9ACTN|nr:hypothetical protein [Actinoplanes digitatis]MBB4767107.1 hypothetical protein [Actinoplanes digitatis]BFE66714.1 hypothetical protein GCM10020092_000150 [Actinoplanes digitatis]
MPIPEAEAGKRVLRRLDKDSTSFGVEAYGLDPEVCQTATGLTAIPLTAICAGVFPWIDGDSDHRMQVLGAAGARLVANANVDGRLHQNLVVFDKTSPALTQLARFASTCGNEQQKGKDGVRRWKIAADDARENWVLMSGGTVLHLRFDMAIGDGFTAAEIQRVADEALQVAVNAGA